MFDLEVTDKETARQHALNRLDILDTPPEESYHRLVYRCSKVLECFGSAVAFVDSDRVWYKASIGLSQHEVSREDAICSYTIERGTPLVISDTSCDERTKDRLVVTGEPHIRSYIGIPLMLTSGDRVGTFSAFDTKPRKFLPNQVILMQRIADIVVRKLELRAALKQLFWEVENSLEAESFA